MGHWEMATLGTADGDGMDRGNVVSELAILVGVCAKTLWRFWGLESIERFALEGWIWVERGGKGGEELLGSERVSGRRAEGLPLRSAGERSDDIWGTSVSSGARTTQHTHRLAPMVARRDKAESRVTLPLRCRPVRRPHPETPSALCRHSSCDGSHVSSRVLYMWVAMHATRSIQ